MILWLAVAFAGSPCSSGEVVVDVVGDSALAGAEIFVDGVLGGRMGPAEGEYCTAAIVVTVGDHEIEVWKAGERS